MKKKKFLQKLALAGALGAVAPAPLPALAAGGLPPVGDESNPTLYIVLMAAAVLGIVAVILLVLRGRKRDKS